MYIEDWETLKKHRVSKKRDRVRVVATPDRCNNWIGYIGKYIYTTFWGDCYGTAAARRWLRGMKEGGWKISRATEIRLNEKFE